MASSRCHRKATHAPPNAAASRGLTLAMQAIAGECTPLSADAQAETWHALQAAPTRKRQGDLLLSLPEPEHG